MEGSSAPKPSTSCCTQCSHLQEANARLEQQLHSTRAELQQAQESGSRSSRDLYLANSVLDHVHLQLQEDRQQLEESLANIDALESMLRVETAARRDLEHELRLVRIRDAQGRLHQIADDFRSRKEHCASLRARDAALATARVAGSSLLRWASCGGHTDVARLVLDADLADVDGAPSEGGMSPLMLACVHDRPDTARLLVERGARLDAARAGRGEFDALQLAGSLGHADVVRTLLESAAATET